MCQPNPCLHRGICSVISESQYSCDCSNTGYIGTKCDIGHFEISNYPTLTSNILSPPVTIISSRPTDYVILHFINRDLEFSPASITFEKNSPLNQSVRITSQQEGYFIIRYSLSGPDANKFALPEDGIVFVNPPYNISNDLETLNFPYGCYKKQLGICPGSGTSITVSSTSPFVHFGPLDTTQGIVSVESGNSIKIPLSLFGINLPHSTATSREDSCSENDGDAFRMESLVKSRSLAKSFTEAANESLPSWLLISLSKQSLAKNIESSELKTRFLLGKQVRESGIETALPVDDDMYYSLLTANKLNISVQNDVDILESKSVNMALDFCGELPANILLRPNIYENSNRINDISILKQLNEHGWIFNVSSIEVSKGKRIKRPKKMGLWNGTNYFDVDASSDGTIALQSRVRKDFKNSDFADIKMDFDGTVIGDFKDVNEVINQ